MELTKDRNGVETPPRAWGRLEWFVSNTVHKRNTPTCVGKTKRVFYTTLPHQKHPHVRGEDGLSYRNRLIEAETPPRAWGRLTTHSIRQQKPRNTPTCVGKTSKVGKWYIVAKKHPHVRGEDVLRLSCTVFGWETPPRAWGRPAVTVDKASFFRNTPTCVGKTNLSSRLRAGVRKHPHVRGEDHATSAFPQRFSETPPRAWGRPSYIIAPVISFRNTPTCVGKTYG